MITKRKVILNQFLKCINEKIDDTKDYQVKKWNEGKFQIIDTKNKYTNVIDSILRLPIGANLLLLRLVVFFN